MNVGHKPNGQRHYKSSGGIEKGGARIWQWQLCLSQNRIKSFRKVNYISRWELGDGSLTQGQDYVGNVKIIGLSDNIEARITAIGNEFIIGRALIDQYRVILDHGRRVEVEK